MHPMAAKKELATEIVETYHPTGSGQHAKEEWERRFSEKRLDQTELPAFSPPPEERNVISIVLSAYDALRSV